MHGKPSLFTIIKKLRQSNSHFAFKWTLQSHKTQISPMLYISYVPVWVSMILASAFLLCLFVFQACNMILLTVNSIFVHYLLILQITFFNNFFIKNRSHNTIYIFKNYFVTVFSVSIFNFSKNKLNPNRPYISILALSSMAP